MKTDLLILRAEIYEGIARTLRKGLAVRGSPITEREKTSVARLRERAEEAERRAGNLRACAKALRGQRWES